MSEDCNDVTWMSAVPDILACVGLFFVPGLLATYLGGLRGITAWAMAPLMTVAVVAAVAVASGFFDFRFGLWPVAAGIVVMAGLAAGLSLLLRRRQVERPPRDPLGYSLAVVAGAVAAAVIGAVTFMTGVARPDAISESYDAVFHYSAIRYIELTGKASPLTIATIGQPGSRGSFYPDAWHAMAALLAELTGAPVTVAATVTCLVVAVLVWPLSCLLLARHLFGASGGRALAAVIITGMLSSLYGEFPWMITGWGVLWPNSLGMALAPAGVALGLSLTKISAGDTFGAVRRWCFGAAGAWAIAISHPNSALSAALICLFPLLIAVGPALLSLWQRHTLATTAAALALVAAVVIGGSLASRLGGPLHVVLAQTYPPVESPRRALLSAFSNGTDLMHPEWLLAVFMVIGVIACFVWRQRRWLVLAELAIAALYVATAGINSPATRLLTGLWYSDSHRIAATLPIVAIPLATMGVLFTGELLARIASRAGAAARPAVALGACLAVGILVAAVTGVQSVPSNAYFVGVRFSTTGYDIFLTPAKLQFLQTVERLVPADALVADDPYTGSAFLFAMSGTRVLFPQVGAPASNTDMAYLAHSIVDLGHDSRACDLVRRYGVGYMLILPDNYLHKRDLPGFYSGVVDPVPDSGFKLVAADGTERLYKITMCQSPAQAGGSIEATSPSG